MGGGKGRGSPQRWKIIASLVTVATVAAAALTWGSEGVQVQCALHLLHATLLCPTCYVPHARLSAFVYH